ncbi:MAG: cell division protein FtsH, partial [Rickettsiales bacterium]|nr:cell division protein FtsH [Rickettsiales bacterium]
AENHAKKILKKNIKHLHNLAKALLEFETMSGDDVNELIKKGKFKSKSQNNKTDVNKKTSLPTSGGTKGKSKRDIGLDPNPATT